MIAYGSSILDHQVHLEDSLGNHRISDNLQSLLNFLLEPYPNQFRIAWDLEAFVAPILSLLAKEQLLKLYETGQAWVKESGHSITYNPKKSLYLTLGSNRAKYYHLKQFFGDDEKEPEVLGELAKKGGLLLSELKGIGIEPKRLSSSVAMIDDLLDGIDFPNWEELPEEVGQMAWECCGRHWTEAHKIGWFDGVKQQVFDYDINSAFPCAVSNLLNLRYGTWVKGRDIPDDAYYGFARGVVDIDSDVSPVVYVDAYGHLYNPKGRRRQVLPLRLIRLIRDFGIGKFKSDSGWGWIPKKVVVGHESEFKPFRELMGKLYGHRQKSRLLNKIMKGASVGSYGRLLQTFRDGTFAKTFNSVYGAIVESEVTAQVAEFILTNKLEADVIHISTDGVLLDKRLGMENGELMGQWRLDSSGPALVVSSGCLFYGDKRPNQISYPEAMEMIRGKPKASSWEKASRRMCTMGDVLEGGGLGDIGKIMPIVVGFGLKIEHDRQFEKLPNSGKELLENKYQSRALSVGKLTKPSLGQSIHS